MAVKTPIPEKKEIDALAALYLEAKANVEKAAEGVACLRDQLTDMVNEHGFVPKKATKSTRIIGETYEITLSRGQSIEVDGTAVMRIRATLKTAGLSKFFRKLFRREVIYVLADGAHQFMVEHCLPADVGRYFAQAVMVRENSPYLKVEPVKEEAAAGKKGRAA
ncbi:MAG: hypothetical protein LAO20_16710 [Acidobacteriia bacterium]|nr:hypothetical protein [Terriglobia bacterium]